MARHRHRVLVVYKKDAFRQYVQEQQDSHLRRLLRRSHPDVLEMRRSHRVHEAALASTIHTLRTLPVGFDLVFRANLKVKKPYDLVVSVGGDGTFLQAARAVKRTPILGVNSNPAHSEAVFCAATARTFPRLIHRALKGQLPTLALSRLQVIINGRLTGPLALNDVLVVHDDPATMSRYRLRIGAREEFQKSSGLWVASAAGSSSAVLAAGGVRLPWKSRKFQYRPRELYQGRLSRYRLTGGVLTRRGRVRVTWLMRRGSIFIDGPHVRIPLRFADQIEIRPASRDPLHVLGLPRTTLRATSR